MNKNSQRWLQVIVGVILLLLAGMVYAWSVLSRPIAAEFTSWSAATLSMTFTLTMIMFCVGCMAGGFVSKMVPPRVLVWVSAGLFLAGFLISSIISSAVGLYLGFGVLCGIASGLVYNAVLGTVNAWFPDKQGLISGILMMGFGLSAFIVGKVYQAWTPAEVGGWRSSFRVMGILIAVVFALCGFLLHRPGKDFTPPAAAAKKKTYVNPVAMDTDVAGMIRQPSFWMYYLWAILLSAAGLALVGQASGIAVQVGPEVDAGTIATVVGLISVFNGVGRVVFGGMFDKVGRSRTMQITNGVFIVAGAILLLAILTKSFVIVTVGFMVGGFAYGGINPTHSAFISSYYGRTNYAMNFSIINTNLIIASFGSTVAASLYDASQSYLSTVAMIIVLAALGVAASFGISFFDKKKLQKQA